MPLKKVETSTSHQFLGSKKLVFRLLQMSSPRHSLTVLARIQGCLVGQHMGQRDPGNPGEDRYPPVKMHEFVDPGKGRKGSGSRIVFQPPFFSIYVLGGGFNHLKNTRYIVKWDHFPK